MLSVLKCKCLNERTAEQQITVSSILDLKASNSTGTDSYKNNSITKRRLDRATHFSGFEVMMQYTI